MSEIQIIISPKKAAGDKIQFRLPPSSPLADIKRAIALQKDLEVSHIRITSLTPKSDESPSEHRPVPPAATVGDLQNHDLYYAEQSPFSGASFENCSFGNVKIVFSGKDLSHVNFKGADLTGVDFARSILNYCDFTDSFGMEGRNFEAQEMRGVRFVSNPVKEEKLGAFLGRRGAYDIYELIATSYLKPLGDFKGCNLQEAVFSGVNCRGCCFDGADLKDAYFGPLKATVKEYKRSDPIDGKLVALDLSVTREEDYNVSGASFVGCILTGTTFDSLDLTSCQIVLSKQDLTNCCFKNCILDGISFLGSNLRNCRFTGCSMIGVDLSETDLSNRDLSTNDLRDSLLNGANLSNSKLIGMNLKKIHLESSNLIHAMLNDSDFSEAVLKNSKLDKSSCHGTIFSKSNISGCSFVGCSADRATFTKSDSRNTDFSSSRLTEARMSSLELSNVNFKCAQCLGTDFSGSNLCSCNFQDSNLTKADLRRADLCGANLSGSVLKQTYLADSNLSGALLVGCIFDQT